MEFPKLNERKHQSNIMMNTLTLEILKTIEKVEKENKYEFQSFERDHVLLEMIQRNHESYLIKKFGHSTI